MKFHAPFSDFSENKVVVKIMYTKMVILNKSQQTYKTNKTGIYNFTLITKLNLDQKLCMVSVVVLSPLPSPPVKNFLPSKHRKELSIILTIAVD